MGYTYFTEVAEGRRATQDQRYQKTAARQWIVRVDSTTYGPIYAASHPSLPVMWTAHPEDAYLRLVNLSSEQDQSDPLLWRVTGDYAYYLDTQTASATGNPAVDTQQQGQPPGDRVQNPLLRPRDYSVATATRPWATWQAWNTVTNTYTKPIVNSAGDPFLPPPEIMKSGATITVGLNSASAPSGFWLSAIDYLNATSLVIGPYTFSTAQVKLNNVSAQLVYENGISYWRWALTFEYRPTWALELIDQGRREKFTPAGGGAVKLIPIIDEVTGQAVSQPVLLDGSGVKLASGGTPQFITYHIYPRITFTGPI